MLKPCIWSSYFLQLPIEKAIDLFLECGFAEAELSDEHAADLLTKGKPEKIGSNLKNYADSLGFRFRQGHMKLSANICSQNSDQLIDELKSWLDLFSSAGIQSAVLHSGRTIDNATDDELLEKRAEALLKLTDYIKDSSIVVCLENLIYTTTDSESLLKIINYVGSDRLGICLDTGHLNISKAEGQYEFIKNAGSHLKALHIADNEGEQDQHLMPYGKGNVNWESVMRGLKEIGYKGAFNFEIPGESSAPLEILKEKLKYVNKIATYMIGEYENV